MIHWTGHARQMKDMERIVELEPVGEVKVIGVNMPQCHVVHHKSHKKGPVIETTPLQ
jgi:hypothetical protein